MARIQRLAARLRDTRIPGAGAMQGSGLTYRRLHDSALHRGFIPAGLRCPLPPPRRARRPGAGPASLDSRRLFRPACKGKRAGMSAAVAGSPPARPATLSHPHPPSAALTRRLQQLQPPAQQRCRHGRAPARPHSAPRGPEGTRTRP